MYYEKALHLRHFSINDPKMMVASVHFSYTIEFPTRNIEDPTGYHLVPRS